MYADETKLTQLGKQEFERIVSIIMPCYNAQAFVGEAIASVVAQTWQNWELLVIDDGSRDESIQVVQEWARKDSRIILLVNQQNMGVSKTRNRGIGLAKGSWIAFLDSDDVWEKDKLSSQMSVAQQKGAEFLFTACSIIDQNSSLLGAMVPLPEKVSYTELQKWNRITCSSVLVSREALHDLRFEHDDSREDYLLWLRILKRLKTAYALGEPLVRYRVISGSRSANKIRMMRDTYRVHRHLNTGPLFSALYTLSHFYCSFMNKYRLIQAITRKRDDRFA